MVSATHCVTVSLRSYGGNELPNKVCVSRGKLIVETVVQVQKEAPTDLLLGTVVLSHLEGLTGS